MNDQDTALLIEKAERIIEFQDLDFPDSSETLKMMRILVEFIRETQQAKLP